jgi:hypothetical protein
MEVYKNNTIISKGELDVDKLIIDENQSRISIVPPPENKTQIFKILSKTKKGDEIVYNCEMKNPNGIVHVELTLDTFYKYLICVGESEKVNGNYVKYYFK